MLVQRPHDRSAPKGFSREDIGCADQRLPRHRIDGMVDCSKILQYRHGRFPGIVSSEIVGSIPLAGPIDLKRDFFDGVPVSSSDMKWNNLLRHLQPAIHMEPSLSHCSLKDLEVGEIITVTEGQMIDRAFVHPAGVRIDHPLHGHAAIGAVREPIGMTASKCEALNRSSPAPGSEATQ